MYGYSNYYTGYGQGSNCICNFPTLVILILVILQFSKGEKRYDDDYDDIRFDKKCGNQHVGNGVLFIIALFFLSCAGCR